MKAVPATLGALLALTFKQTVEQPTGFDSGSEVSGLAAEAPLVLAVRRQTAVPNSTLRC